MQVPYYSLAGEEKGKVSLGKIFSEKVRTDLIKRAVLSEMSEKRQPYGADKLAGFRSSAHYHGERGAFNSMMNKEMARMSRIHSMGYLNFTARVVPQATKGRKAHPPKPEKVWREKINKKEWLKALHSALAASAQKELVLLRNHDVAAIKSIPIVFEDKIEELRKSKELETALVKMGLQKELERTKEKKERAGRGKSRGRRTKRRRGPLLIVKEDKGISKAGKNIAGLEVTTVKNLKVEQLAPGTQPGRLCIWSKSAIEEMGK